MRPAPTARAELHAALAAGYTRVYAFAHNWVEQRVAKLVAEGATEVAAVSIVAQGFLAECESISGARAPGLLDIDYSYQRSKAATYNANAVRPSIAPLRALIAQLDAMADAATLAEAA